MTKINRQKLTLTAIRLLIGSCLAIVGLGAFWLSRGKGDVNENARGANQEYEKNAEGNK